MNNPQTKNGTGLSQKLAGNDLQREIYLASIRRRQRRDQWTVAAAFFWLFATAVAVAIVALSYRSANNP